MCKLLNAIASSLQIQVKIFFKQRCLSTNALVNFLVLHRIWAVSDGFPAISVGPNRNHEIFRQGKSSADGPLDHNFELQGCFPSLHGTTSRDISSTQITRFGSFGSALSLFNTRQIIASTRAKTSSKLLSFLKKQNPRRGGQGSAGGWLEASNFTRCQPKDPRNPSVASMSLQARSLSNIRALCTTFGLALASIVFAVVSPASAQFNGCPAGFCSGFRSSPPASGPTFTYQGPSAATGGQTQTTAAITIGATAPQVVVIGLANITGGNSISSPSISTGGTCNVYAFENGSASAMSAFIECITSGTGTATITFTYGANPFTGTPIAAWTAPSSGFSSTTPTGGSGVGNIATGATTVSASSLNAAAGGTCLYVASNSLNSSTTVSFGGTFSSSITTRLNTAANGVNIAAGDTIGNSVSTTSSATTSAGWGSGGNLALSAACWS